MSRGTILLAAAALLASGPLALAQNSTTAPPPQAGKEGGVAGDPRGAIRAVGGTSQTDFKQGDNVVDVPKLGGDVNINRSGGLPRGTTPP